MIMVNHEKIILSAIQLSKCLRKGVIINRCVFQNDNCIGRIMVGKLS